MKKLGTLIIAILVLVGVALGIRTYFSPGEEPVSGAATPKDATYRIDGQAVTLINGSAEASAAPGSASKIVTRYFGNDATGDINGDGIEDTAFLLTQNSGGSGTFYYVVGAIKTAGGYTGTDAVLLGDRIAPQSTQIKDGLVTVNYADRNPGEDFATQPSLGKTIVLKLDAGSLQFGEVAQNFEGEADPSTMTLTMKEWKWIQTSYGSSTSVTPKTQAFAITFKPDNTFSATTDCNSVGGQYIVKAGSISLGKMVSTKMFCEGSQETDFTTMLDGVRAYSFTTRGELVLDFASSSSGHMTFK